MCVPCWFSCQSFKLQSPGDTYSNTPQTQREGCTWACAMGPSWSPLPLPLSRLPFSPFIKERPTSRPSESYCDAFLQGKKSRTPNKGVTQNLADSVEKMNDSSDWVTNPSQFFAFNKLEEGSDGVVSW